MDQLYDAIEMCLDITNTNDECDFLSGFIECIISDNDEQEIDLLESKDKLFFKEVLYDNRSLRYNFEKVWQCSKGSDVKWKVAEELDWFVFYLFLRRFGWPDLEEEGGLLKVALPDSMIRFRKSSKIDELKYKTQLVDLLDSVLLWLSQQPVSSMSVLMYSSAIRLASKVPVTRLHLSIRGSDWLKENLMKDINEKLWHGLQGFLILGVTDVWSRIRDASIARLGPIVEFLQLPQILSLFDELILLCDPNQNQWQTIDGAISAIGAILKRFHKVGYRSNSLQIPYQTKRLNPRIQCHIKIGDIEIDRMPPLLMSRLKVLVLSLIHHPQQTIRDNAVKAFVLCLDRYADHEIDAAFQDVYQRLSNRAGGVPGNVALNSRSPLTSTDPYGAQSLICLCQHLFKRVPDKISYLENWYYYHCSFDVYLCHPASSVRLVTSTLYKYAISQSISHPLLVKNILYYLVVKWTPSQSVLLQNINGLSKTINSQSHKRLSITRREETKNESSFWEWREGRLLVYELFAKLIIKNHLWYTFGTTEVESVYSSENATSRPPGSANINLSPSGSNLNLCDSSFAMNVEKSNLKLSSSLDSRRMSLAGLYLPIFKSNIKSISRRRNSHDVMPNQSLNDAIVSKVESIRSSTIGKLNSSTSTQNIKSIMHSSFLAQVKEMEDLDDVPSNPRSTVSHDTDKKLPTFRSILSQMLHTSAESLIDSQWELRRMAKQTLPPLGEVLRWFDPGLLVNIISTHLKFEPTLMTYVSLALLHDALLHASRLKQLLISPPSSWQPSVGNKIVLTLVTSVESNIAEWVKSCQHYLDRSSTFDCVTPVSMNISITCCSNFGHLVPMSNLVKSIVDAFFRLDGSIKSKVSNLITTYSFYLYPSPFCASSDNQGLDYAVQLVDYVKENLIQWWQNLSLHEEMMEFCEQYREAIVACSRLLPLLAGWLHPVSNMKGDSSRCARDILKLLQVLSRLLFRVMGIDSSTRLVFLGELAGMMEVFTKYVLCRELKLNSCWLYQLSELSFIWLEKFPQFELDQCLKSSSDDTPLVISILQALLQRLHSNSKQRRATISSIVFNSPTLDLNSKRKRRTISEGYHNLAPRARNFVRSENKRNIELYSSLTIGDNIEYVSDGSLNDGDEDKTVSDYKESHVLNTPRNSSIHSISSSLDCSIGRNFKFRSEKSLSLQAPSDIIRKDFKDDSRRSSTESEEEVDASDWDSSTESDKEVRPKKEASHESVTDDSVFVTQLIQKLMASCPSLFHQCQALLSEMDVTILKSLRL